MPEEDDGNADPPAGRGNPYDGGELLVVDDTTAVHRGGPDVGAAIGARIGAWPSPRPHPP